MRGHEALIAMRCRGKAPEVVFLATYTDRLRQWSDWHQLSPHMASLELEPIDRPSRMDLRCLVALTVVISGTNADRVSETAQACRDAGAGRVIAVTTQPQGEGEFRQSEVVTVADTEGVLTWHS